MGVPRWITWKKFVMESVFPKIRAIVNFTKDFFLGNFPIFLEELFGIAPLGKCVYLKCSFRKHENCIRYDLSPLEKV